MSQNPFELFSQWYSEVQNSSVKEPTSMTLATANKQGQPSARIVLLKAWDERGFVFYTNETSRKGQDLLENPQASLLFYFMELQKQIRIEGEVEAVSKEESDAYYNSRHLESRIGAWASKQSQVLPARDELLQRIVKYNDKFGDNPPRPDFWHGFRLKPKHIEFWKEGSYRLHERDIFERDGEGWKHFQIYP